MKRHILAGLSLVVGGALLATTALAADDYKLDKRWYLAPGLNYTFTDGSGNSRFDRRADENLGGNLAIGRAISKSFNLDLRLSGADLPGTGTAQNTEHYSLSADILYFPNRNRIAPYFGLGIGVMRSAIAGESFTNPVANMGVGLQAQFADSGAAIRGGLNWRVDFFDADTSDEFQEYGEFVPSINLVLPLGRDKARTEWNRQSLVEADLDTRWHLGISAGWLWPDSSRDSNFGLDDGDVDGGLSYSVSVGRAVSEKWNTEFRLFGAELEIDSNRTTAGEFDFYGAVASVQYFINRNQRFAPFLEAGLGAMRSEVFGRTETNPVFEAGFGFVSRLNDHGLGLRAGVRARMDAYDISDNTSGITEFIDWETYAGIYVPLGARRTVSAPVPVVAPIVAEFRDDDGDGVANEFDSCPNTAAGEPVDSLGCELDSDSDGVPDNRDRCPYTAAGVAVGIDGCALDSDGDGVLNAVDQCPNTPAGQAVDSNGCPLAEVIVIYFNTDSSALSAASKAKLDRISRQLLERNYVVALLGGHADSRASDAYNDRLAKRRANSVKAYLVARGILDSNLTARSFGEKQPVGDNSSPAGRALNRRVEIKLLNP